MEAYIGNSFMFITAIRHKERIIGKAHLEIFSRLVVEMRSISFIFRNKRIITSVGKRNVLSTPSPYLFSPAGYKKKGYIEKVRMGVYI